MSLQQLKLRVNGITNISLELNGMTELEILDLSRNNVVEIDDSSFCNTSIRELDLSVNSIQVYCIHFSSK